MATFPHPARPYSTGGSSPKSYYIVRDGATVSILCANNNTRHEEKCVTVAEAKRLMNHPGRVCMF